MFFPLQVWLSFAQFETSTALEENIEQARLVKIIVIHSVVVRSRPSFHVRSKCKAADYLPRKKEILDCRRQRNSVFLSGPSYLIVFALPTNCRLQTVPRYSVWYCASLLRTIFVPRSHVHNVRDFPQAIKLDSSINARFLSKFGLKILLYELKK